MTVADRPRWLILSLLIVVCAARTGAWQSLCDGACLARLADEYFSAIAAHNPEKELLVNGSSDFLR